jgi:hypothetical protein
VVGTTDILVPARVKPSEGAVVDNQCVIFGGGSSMVNHFNLSAPINDIVYSITINNINAFWM